MRSAAAQTALTTAAVPYLLFEAVYETVAASGRDRFLDVVAPWFPAVATLQGLALTGLAAAATATAREVRAARTRGALDDGTSLRALSLALGLGFVASRFGATPLGAAARGLDAFGAYGTMASAFDRPPYVAAAALGIPFAALHVFLASRRALALWVTASRASAIAGALGALSFAALVDATAWFAIGRTFIPR